VATSKEVKDQALAKLGEEKSDMLEQTQAFCKSALPEKESKRKMWNGIVGKEYDNVSLLEHDELCAGFKQRLHLEIIKEFQNEFFAKIEEIVATKTKNLADNIYHYLQPNVVCSTEDIKQFEDCLAAVQQKPAGETTARLVNWLKDSITDMKEKKAAREESAAWESKAKL